MFKYPALLFACFYYANHTSLLIIIICGNKLSCIEETNNSVNPRYLLPGEDTYLRVPEV